MLVGFDHKPIFGLVLVLNLAAFFFFFAFSPLSLKYLFLY